LLHKSGKEQTPIGKKC